MPTVAASRRAARTTADETRRRRSAPLFPRVAAAIRLKSTSASKGTATVCTSNKRTRSPKSGSCSVTRYSEPRVRDAAADEPQEKTSKYDQG